MAGPSIDIADETFVVADRHRLADYFAAPSVWRAWWPRLRMTMAEDRGIEGVRWSVSGGVLGTAEIWLEDWGDGAIVHWFLRGEPPPGTSRRQCVRLGRNLNVAYKARIHELKDRVERGRPAGVSRAETVERLDNVLVVPGEPVGGTLLPWLPRPRRASSSPHRRPTSWP